MEIIISSLEAEGFFKVGGIGDYISGLSKSLANEDNFNVKVFMPKFKDIDEDNMEFLTRLSIDGDSNSFDDELLDFNVYKGKLDNVDFYFIDNEHYFNESGVNVYLSGIVYLKFAFFSRAIVETVKHMGWDVDVLHLNDHPDGLLPLICKNNVNAPKFVFTIHSIYYQGDYEIDRDYLDLFNYYLGFEWKEDSICFMKEAVMNSDILITVGKTNAEDIQTPEHGYGLDNYVRDSGVTGLLNGINYDLYPRCDNFNEFLEIKREAKSNIQRKFDLEVNEDIPLFLYCGRLGGTQKGCHFLLDVIDSLMEDNCQFILLADGERFREEFIENSKIHRNFVACIELNSSLARDLYEASDILLMPSLCEPNGLSQIIAMYHGTVPIVHNTGGLKDTIVDIVKYPDDGNGFKFYNYTVDEF